MDNLQRFFFARSGIRGHWVDLADTLTELNARHSYDAALLALLGEMLAVVAMVADGSKWPGSVALQVTTPASDPSPLQLAMAEYRPGGKLRGIARLKPDASPSVAADTSSKPAAVLTQGQLTLSMLPNSDQVNAQPYQGIVELSEGSLAANLDRYFINSEQVPTRFFLAANGERAIGLLLQRLPNNAKDPWSEEAEDTAWQRVNQQVDDLIPENVLSSSSETLLSDLLEQGFVDDPIELAEPKSVHFACTCTRQRTGRALRTISPKELLELLDELGELEVTCEFCGKGYIYTRLDTHELLAGDDPQPAH